jgi:hypothetical protein
MEIIMEKKANGISSSPNAMNHVKTAGRKSLERKKSQWHGCPWVDE